MSRSISQRPISLPPFLRAKELLRCGRTHSSLNRSCLSLPRGSIQLNLNKLFNRISTEVLVIQGVPHHYKNSVEKSVEC